MPKFARPPLAAQAVAMLLILATAHFVRAEEKTLLRWKFTPGETSRYEMLQNINQTLDLGEGAPPIPISAKQTMDIAWKADSIEGPDTIAMTQTIERMRMKMQSPQGVLMEYDSASEKQPEGMLAMLQPILEAIVKKPMQMTFTTRGEVKQLKLPQGMLENVNKVLGGQAGNFLSEDWMKEMGQLAILPEGPVAPGETWTRKNTAKNPIAGNLDIQMTFRYEGIENRDGRILHKITLSAAFDAKEAEKRGEKKPAMFTLKGQESKGTMYFDAEAGQLVESSMNMKMKMDLNVMGKKLTQNIDMVMEMKRKPTSENPDPQKK